MAKGEQKGNREAKKPKKRGQGDSGGSKPKGSHVGLATDDRFRKEGIIEGAFRRTASLTATAPNSVVDSQLSESSSR
jgi:hypothetical protein